MTPDEYHERLDDATLRQMHRQEMESSLEGQFRGMLERLDDAQLERMHRYWPTFQRSLMQIVEMVTAERKGK